MRRFVETRRVIKQVLLILSFVFFIARFGWAGVGKRAVFTLSDCIEKAVEGYVQVKQAQGTEDLLVSSR